MSKPGILYLLPCPIAEDTLPLDVLPSANLEIIRSLRYFIVENTRSARRFLSKCNLEVAIDDLTFVELNEHTVDEREVERMVERIAKGENGGVISEAGCPSVADPGQKAVALCHKKGIRVIPLVGPSSILLAVMASGLSGQSFAFNGYLPIKEPERTKALRKLESRAQQEGQSQVFIEAPYRNIKLLEQILKCCNPATRVCVACNITSKDEYIQTHTVSEWKKSGIPEINKLPTIFILG